MAFAAPAAPVFRKTKQGFVVYGPADQIEVGPVDVTLRSGQIKRTHILSLGAVFKVECGTDVRYGYQTASSEDAAVAALQGTSQPTSQPIATTNSFIPDSSFSGEEDVPAHYEGSAFTSEFTMPPAYEPEPPYDFT